MSMDANVTDRLGSPAVVAETALREYRQRSSVLSRSWLAAFCTFVLSPLPVLFLAWLGSVAAIAAIGELLKSIVPDPTVRWPITPRAESIVQGVFLAYVVIASIVVSALYARLARKTAHLWHWGVAACLIVALGSMAVFTQFEVKRSDVPGKNQVMFGVGFKTKFLNASRLIQFALPFAAGLLVLRRSARSIPSPDEVPEAQAGDGPDGHAAAQAA